MVDKQYQFVSRQITDSVITTNDYPDECIQSGLGAFISVLKTGVVWSSMEKTQHINVLELKAIYLVLLTFPKEAKNATAQPPDGQCICPDSISSEFRNDKILHGNLNVFVEQKHLNNMGVSAQ